MPDVGAALSRLGNRLARLLRRGLAPGTTVNVALTGTSNCVVTNGLSAGIATHPKTRLFRNKSFGASGTVAIAAHMADFDLGGYDYVFIEYCLNESTLIASGREKLENTYRNIAAMIDHAAAAGCVPVLVNLPTVNTIGRRTPMLTALETEFVSRGVALFDMQHLLEERARSRGIDMRACFMDAMHLERPIAFALGRVLIDSVERARAAGAIRQALSVTDAEFGPVGFLPASREPGSDGTVIERANRFLHASLLQMVPGQSVTFPAPGRLPCVLGGVTYNARRSIGRLVAQDGTVVFDVKPNRLFGTERDLLMVSLPTTMPQLQFEGAVRLVYQAPDVAEFQGAGGRVRHPATFEIAGITVHERYAYAPMRVIEVAEPQRRLHETLTTGELEMINRACDTCVRNRTMDGGSSAGSGVPDEA